MEQVKLDIHGLAKFRSVSDSMAPEKEYRNKNAKDILKFGIKFLDEALHGIAKNDLILLGAKTGAGKTELAVHIAQTNAAAGKRVVYFALEAEDQEIERRLLFKSLAKFYFKDLFKMFDLKINYQDWVYGLLDEKLSEYEPELSMLIAEKLKTLKTFYRSFGDYGVEDFEKHFLSLKHETDLFILDHLHYLDYDDSDGNAAMKKIIKTCRDLALISGVPVIVIAHLRKSDRKSKIIIPDIEDFHGSSDIGKIATKAIMLAPAYDFNRGNNKQFSTYINICKNRIDGSRARYCAVASFDIQKNCYDDEYILGQVKNFGETFEKISSTTDMPHWARSSKEFGVIP